MNDTALLLSQCAIEAFIDQIEKTRGPQLMLLLLPPPPLFLLMAA